MYWTLAKTVQLSSGNPPTATRSREVLWQECGADTLVMGSAPELSASAPWAWDRQLQAERTQGSEPHVAGGPRDTFCRQSLLGHSPQNQGTQWWGEQEWDPGHSHAVTALGTQPLSTRKESLSPSRRGDALCRGPPGEQSDSCRRRTARPHATLVCQCYDARLIEIW